MRQLSVKCPSVLIFGDLNSRTKYLQDYVMPDNEVFENIHMQDTMNCNLSSRVLRKMVILDCIDRILTPA